MPGDIASGVRAPSPPISACHGLANGKAMTNRVRDKTARHLPPQSDEQELPDHAPSPPNSACHGLANGKAMT